MKKVLEILNSYPGETFVWEHIKALNNYCTNIKLVVAYTQTQYIKKIKSKINSIPCYGLANKNRLSKKNKIKLCIKYGTFNISTAIKKDVLKQIKKIDPDHIHFHFASTTINWVWIAQELNIPYTFSVRGSDIQILPFTQKGYCNQLALITNKCVGVHFVCKALKNSFNEIIPYEKNKEIPQIIIRTAISNEWSNIKRNPKNNVFLSIGRLHWVKSYSDLILSMNQISKKYPKCVLYIIGEGVKREELELMIRKMQLENNVYLLSYQDHQQIAEYMKNATYIVQTSLFEGFPNSLAEAMFAQIPIISSDCGGVCEVLKDQENAYIYETGNIKDLTAKLTLAITEGGEEKWLKNNLDLAESLFNHEKHATDFSKFYLKENNK